MEVNFELKGIVQNRGKCVKWENYTKGIFINVRKKINTKSLKYVGSIKCSNQHIKTYITLNLSGLL